MRFLCQWGLTAANFSRPTTTDLGLSRIVDGGRSFEGFNPFPSASLPLVGLAGFTTEGDILDFSP